MVSFDSCSVVRMAAKYVIGEQRLRSCVQAASKLALCRAAFLERLQPLATQVAA